MVISNSTPPRCLGVRQPLTEPWDKRGEHPERDIQDPCVGVGVNSALQCVGVGVNRALQCGGVAARYSAVVTTRDAADDLDYLSHCRDIRLFPAGMGLEQRQDGLPILLVPAEASNAASLVIITIYGHMCYNYAINRSNHRGRRSRPQRPPQACSILGILSIYGNNQ